MHQKDDRLHTETIYIKNMVCNCCVRILSMSLKENSIQVDKIRLGMATITYDTDELDMEKINSIIQENGMELVVGHEQKIVERIKTAVIELIHQMNNADSIVQKSEYLVGKLGLSYQQLSKIFSRHESITLERFIILNKIERIKELIDQEEYTLSEIAFLMDYSSVQYLSNQFHKITGLSVSEYKKNKEDNKKPLHSLY
ncbi:helix-turn-helix domain-containing protein [Labilibaculum sp. A4]|uniref:AraC family transcriptional regulator n=1 Tax=Labilibaculum euxinus TaxID=2686357 RepID=UPI000F625071|nr:AraC family transcriptional regulator [Labilibaculum euxinus]MDQ1770124.1 AraC family transcriptional regulator [Labilibaculum euxinus]MWN77664.1 helix-turn-helix domain-containing protein [Labilibaculum euxinus]